MGIISSNLIVSDRFNLMVRIISADMYQNPSYIYIYLHTLSFLNNPYNNNSLVCLLIFLKYESAESLWWLGIDVTSFANWDCNVFKCGLDKKPNMNIEFRYFRYIMHIIYFHRNVMNIHIVLLWVVLLLIAM